MRNRAYAWRKPSLLFLVLTAACGSSSSKPTGGDGGNPPGDTGSPPDAKAVPPVSQFAKLCAQEKSDLATAMCPAGDAECTSGCTYFFSAAQGSDTADGKSASTAWQSLAKLENLKLKSGDVLCLHRGDTFRGGAELTDDVHADPANPVVMRPYGPPSADKPIMSGARVIPASWTVSSLSPKLMQTSLASVLKRGPTYQSGGKSYTQRERIYQLFAAGQPQRLATFPNPGEGPSVVQGVNLPGGHYSLIDSVPSSKQVRDSRLPTSNPLTGAATNWTGARFYYRQIRWVIDALDVTAFDAGSRTLTLSDVPDCATDNCVGWGYFLIDNLSALDAPGEWYYDDSAQLLYFYPPAGLDLATTPMEASVYTADVKPSGGDAPYELDESGLNLQGSSGFRIYGIAFEHFSGEGLSSHADIESNLSTAMASSTEIRVEGCAFNYTGPTGVAITRWGDIAGADGNNRISGNAFLGQTSQAIIVQTTESEVACNTVDDIGLLEQYPRAGMFGNGEAPSEHGMAVYLTTDGIRALYNRVQRTASAGISFRGANSTIAYNFVRHACYVKSDCGGIHTFSWQDDAPGFDMTGISGSVVMNNIVLESLGSSEGDGSGYDSPMAQGLFLDFGSHDYVVKGNVSALNTSTGILLARNRNVTVDGNLVYANLRDNGWNYPYSQLQMETEYPPTNAQLTNNVIVAVAPLQIPMGMRGVTLAQAGSFANNTYFDPFAYDATSTNGYLENYLIFVAPGDNTTRVGYYLREWKQVSGETPGPAAPFYWQADRVTQELSGNLISNGTFDSGVAGWTKNSGGAAAFTADNHPVLGPCLRYDRNGDTGGGIGVMSNSFALEAGQTYWVHLWIAPADGVTVPLPPTLNLGENDGWTFVPSDRVREVTLLVQPATSQSKAVLEFTPYPENGDRFWIDDVMVKKVTAEPYDQGTAIRFDQAPPAAVRSFLVYNDTDVDQSVDLGTAGFVDVAGTRHTGTMPVPTFGAVVLFPEAWTVNPSK